MNSQQDVIYGLMNELEEALDNKGMPLLGFSIVRKDTVTNILDKLYAALPDEIKEARALLRRKDELQYEAQQRAEKIVADAQAESNRLLSESDLLRAVQREAEKIKEQVITDCEEIKRKAMDEAENVRIQANDEATRIKDGATATSFTETTVTFPVELVVSGGSTFTELSVEYKEKPQHTQLWRLAER